MQVAAVSNISSTHRQYYAPTPAFRCVWIPIPSLRAVSCSSPRCKAQSLLPPPPATATAATRHQDHHRYRRHLQRRRRGCASQRLTVVLDLRLRMGSLWAARCDFPPPVCPHTASAAIRRDGAAELSHRRFAFGGQPTRRRRGARSYRNEKKRGPGFASVIWSGACSKPVLANHSLEKKSVPYQVLAPAVCMSYS